MEEMRLELTEQQQRLFDWVDSTTSAKYRFKNALQHLQKAWEIKDIDLDMAVFRSITAEEEAATGIFLALQRKGYQNASRLAPRDHKHKAALIPFLHVLQEGIKSIIGEGATVEFLFGAPHDQSRMKIRVEMYFDGQGYHIWPEPPLGLTLNINGNFIDLSDSLRACSETRLYERDV